MRNVTAAPGRAFVFAATSAGERIASPSMARMRSPARSPARAAGLSGSTSSISGAPRSVRNPSRGMKLPSQSEPESDASETVRRRRTPSGRSTSIAMSAAPEARSRRQRRSCQLRTGAPSAATTRSPSRMPATAAGVFGGGAASSARCAGIPATKVPAKSSTASSRLAIGPAATMAILFQTLCRLKARARSPARDGAFALVDHLHVAAERNGGNGPFGAVGAEAARPHDAPESDREPQHLDPAPARHPVVAKLVEYDEHAQHDEEREQLGHGVHQAASGSFSHARATARASRSAARASSIVCTGRAGRRASASAHAGAMSV